MHTPPTTRRLAPLLTLNAFGLAACGQGTDVAAEQSPTDASAAASTRTDTASPETRVVTDAAGRQVEIPANPQRVIDVGGDPATGPTRSRSRCSPRSAWPTRAWSR